MELENFENLVEAYRPNVNPQTVLLLSKQDLRCSVPKCFNLVSKGFDWETKSSCESEISNFKSSSAINEKILRLKVSVDDSPGVTIVDSVAKLIEKQLNLVGSHGHLMLAEVFLHVVLN